MAAEAETPEVAVKMGEVVPAKNGHGSSSVGGQAALEKFLFDATAQDEGYERNPMDSIIQQVLNAESPAAVLTPTEVLQARDLVNTPILLIDFELNKSEFDVGAPFYASMAIMLPGSTPAVANCGHKKVLAQLVKLKQFDEFPYRVMFITRGQSQQGTPMLELTAWTEEQFSDNPPF